MARREEGDRRPFSMAVIASIAISPIVWLHYFTLLVAPLALARPRLAWPWALLWRSGSFPRRGTRATSGGSCSRSALRPSAAVLCARRAIESGSRVSVRAEAQVEPAVEGEVQSTSAAGLARAAPRAARDLAYVLVALFAFVSALLVIRAGFRDDTIGFDFRGTLWDAALAIRDGSSPYPSPVESGVEAGNPALYPPFLMLLVTPLTLLPWWLGVTLWTAIQVGAIVGALAILGVRDPGATRSP